MLPKEHQWHTSQINQYQQQNKQALLTSESGLASFTHDFGNLIHSKPSAVCTPKNTQSLQSVISFANQHQLPVTIRGKGLSQGGQSLAVEGGLILSMEHFTKTYECEDSTIWVEANASWADVLHKTIPKNKAPFIVPYNANLSIGGVLSAGGIGSSSFKYGSINAHIEALEIIDSTGTLHEVDNNSLLFEACLSGQGLFGVITKAKIRLRPVKSRVKTFYLVYADPQQWFADMAVIRERADYLEAFCSPSIQGTALKGSIRVPIAQWLYTLQVTIAYENKAPELQDILELMSPWKVIHAQEEPLLSYFLRHDIRFDMMKRLGQWDLLHPWYENFVPSNVLETYLESILQELPLHYANIVHVVPVAPKKGGFLMLPSQEGVYSLMILNPGIPNILKDSCIETIHALDAQLIPLGGKRYLSGFLGKEIPHNYWSKHFGTRYSEWLERKKILDPSGIFTSMLYAD